MNYGDKFKGLFSGAFDYGSIPHSYCDLHEFIGKHKEDYVFKHLKSRHQHIVSEFDLRHQYEPASNKEIALDEVERSLKSLDLDSLRKIQSVIDKQPSPTKSDKERIEELERQMALQTQISQEMVAIMKEMTEGFNLKIKATDQKIRLVHMGRGDIVF